jgi:hypothetical protein
MKKYKCSNEQVAQILEDFVAGKGRHYSWEDFTLGMSFDDENLERIRIRCVQLCREFPPEHPKEYCNARGRKVIRDYIRQLRSQR